VDVSLVEEQIDAFGMKLPEEREQVH
jgi:hypothetical protein